MKAKLSNKEQMWIVGFAGLLVMLLIALIINWVRLGALSSTIKDTRADSADLRGQIAANETLKDYLSSDEYAEYIARTELDMKQEGETVLTAE